LKFLFNISCQHVFTPLPGRNPCWFFDMLGLSSSSKKPLSIWRYILHGFEGTPSGRSFPFGFGIYTRFIFTFVFSFFIILSTSRIVFQISDLASL